jgi:DnaJ-class molecular chaperone
MTLSITIKVLNKTTQSNLTSPPDCEICQSDPPTKFRQAVLENPLSDDETYERFKKSSHRTIECPQCVGTGEIQCPNCNGNGRERCPSCDGHGKITQQQDCHVCDGTIEFEVRCSTCAGEGHITCQRCSGTRTVDCDRCKGSGEIHKYDSTIFNVTYDIEASDMPRMWDSSLPTLAEEFDFSKNHLNAHEITKRRGDLYTKPIECSCARLQYGDDQHNLLLVHNLPDIDFIWDPETSYPSTSVRRKLGDLKSRLFR